MLAGNTRSAGIHRALTRANADPVTLETDIIVREQHRLLTTANRILAVQIRFVEALAIPSRAIVNQVSSAMDTNVSGKMVTF